ncbi:MAG: ATP-dependent Clp protease ATP-binding subunit [Candidatus Woesebacteria bacterium]|jgi:ATP-dependent Clp protease ATP-binding subunit ClpC
MKSGQNFNFSSARARKARLAVFLQRKLVSFALVLLEAMLLAGGSFLTLVDFWYGVFLASLVVWPSMLTLWNKYELKNVPPNTHSQTVDDILGTDVLGKMPPNPTPQQIAEVVMTVGAGQFYMGRFGIGPNFLTELSAKNVEASAAVWQRADQIRAQFGAPVISAPMIIVALIDQMPGRDQLLARLQLDFDDLMSGVDWYLHISKLIDSQKDQKNKGGIGRDWSFGYTPLLQKFALNVSDAVLRGGLMKRDLEGHQDILRQMVNVLGGNGRRNLALIGQTGTGKTTLVYAFAEQIMSPDSSVPKTLAYSQVMALDPASLIAQAGGRGELEGLVQRLFVEAISAKNIVIFLDDAQLFLEDGTGSVNLSNLLLPILDGGALRLIMAMDEQRWLRLAQNNPALSQHINRVNVAPLGEKDSIRVLEDQLLVMEYRYKVTYMYQALKEAYRLGDRYVQDQAMPGKAIILLEAAAQLAQDGLVTANSVQQAVEKSYGVKVGNAQAVDERETLLNLEDLIHKRMINQKRAVSVVSNALRRARAGVRNQDRPIGSFLFLGPTGVGKTELAKSLASVYFGGEDRLVRVDLNEFGQPQDVNRLIADGAQDPNSLTAQIGKQPFSVVLLDEIEKAHPNVLNTLLQLLDEGVLRDINNRAISFRDAIVIATSNAGADRIRQHIDAGEELEKFEGQFVNELIDSGQFKPEFLNRFDEIVVFRPLNQAELLQVVDLIMAGINKTLSSQKISVQIDDNAKKALVAAGYDPRLGARPMRRVVQRAVEDLVARRMLAGEAPAGSVVKVGLQDIQEALQK